MIQTQMTLKQKIVLMENRLPHSALNKWALTLKTTKLISMSRLV
jgi:hypothetical protein